jgi:hypothetical protein
MMMMMKKILKELSLQEINDNRLRFEVLMKNILRGEDSDAGSEFFIFVT